MRNDKGIRDPSFKIDMVYNSHQIYNFQKHDCSLSIKGSWSKWLGVALVKMRIQVLFISSVFWSGQVESYCVKRSGDFVLRPGLVRFGLYLATCCMCFKLTCYFLVNKRYTYSLKKTRHYVLLDPNQKKNHNRKMSSLHWGSCFHIQRLRHASVNIKPLTAIRPICIWKTKVTNSFFIYPQDLFTLSFFKNQDFTLFLSGWSLFGGSIDQWLENIMMERGVRLTPSCVEGCKSYKVN